MSRSIFEGPDFGNSGLSRTSTSFSQHVGEFGRGGHVLEPPESDSSETNTHDQSQTCGASPLHNPPFNSIELEHSDSDSVTKRCSFGYSENVQGSIHGEDLTNGRSQSTIEPSTTSMRRESGTEGNFTSIVNEMPQPEECDTPQNLSQASHKRAESLGEASPLILSNKPDKYSIDALAEDKLYHAHARSIGASSRVSRLIA